MPQGCLSQATGKLAGEYGKDWKKMNPKETGLKNRMEKL
jgi:hypothetical protein